MYAIRITLLPFIKLILSAFIAVSITIWCYALAEHFRVAEWLLMPGFFFALKLYPDAARFESPAIMLLIPAFIINCLLYFILSFIVLSLVWRWVKTRKASARHGKSAV